MSETTSPSGANQQQGTPSYDALEQQIAADEAARNAPEQKESESEVKEEVKAEESEEHTDDASEDTEESEKEATQKRIARLAYEARQAKQFAKQVAEENARLRGQAPPVPQNEEIERLANERAAMLAEREAYNQRANQVYHEGVKEYPDFATALTNMRQAGLNLSDQVVEAALEVGHAHRLVHYLANNLDEADRIMHLPPHRMGAALAKLQTRVNPQPKTSKAPEPIKPIAGRAKAERSIEDMPLAEYMAQEDAKYFKRRR